MKLRKTSTLLIAFLAILFTLLSVGCTATRTENGVIIQEPGGLNPFNYFN
ncbi:MAG: hypothetical protein ACON39_02660 [Coraliomargaritaceae bacterium]